jgi:hypothetical protein
LMPYVGLKTYQPITSIPSVQRLSCRPRFVISYVNRAREKHMLTLDIYGRRSIGDSFWS